MGGEKSCAYIYDADEVFHDLSALVHPSLVQYSAGYPLSYLREMRVGSARGPARREMHEDLIGRLYHGRNTVVLFSALRVTANFDDIGRLCAV